MTDNRDVCAGSACWRILRQSAKVASVPGIANNRAQGVSLTSHHAKGRRKFGLDYQRALVHHAVIRGHCLVAYRPAFLTDTFALFDRIADRPNQPFARRQPGKHTARRPLSVGRLVYALDVAERRSFPCDGRYTDQNDKEISAMPVGLHAEMRIPADHVSEHRQKLKENTGRIAFTVRFDCAHDLTRQPVEGFPSKGLWPLRDCFCCRTGPFIRRPRKGLCLLRCIRVIHSLGTPFRDALDPRDGHWASARTAWTNSPSTARARARAMPASRFSRSQ